MARQVPSRAGRGLALQATQFTGWAVSAQPNRHFLRRPQCVRPEMMPICNTKNEFDFEPVSTSNLAMLTTRRQSLTGGRALRNGLCSDVTSELGEMSEGVRMQEFRVWRQRN